MPAERAIEPGNDTGSTVDQLLREGARQLAGVGDSPRLDAELLLAHALGEPREFLYRSLFAAVSPEVAARFRSLIAERAGRRPVAHLTGRHDFWTFTLEVSRAALLPRPETELLVERALQRLPREGHASVLDLGTGTGCVALALAAERPQSRITATDLSKPALALARRNARTLGIANVRFAHGHWYAAVEGRRFDVIVSNPPYIADDEWHTVDPELEYEPRMSLVSGRRGLRDLGEIVAGAPAALEPGGWLLVEHGHAQADAVQALFRDAGFRAVTTQTDLAGRPRVTEGRVERGT